MKEWVDARKVRYGAKELPSVLEGVRSVTVAKGKKLETFDVTKSSVADLAAVMLGPTGNLRAPTLRCGTKLFVGFHPDGLSGFLGI